MIRLTILSALALAACSTTSPLPPIDRTHPASASAAEAAPRAAVSALGPDETSARTHQLLGQPASHEDQHHHY